MIELPRGRIQRPSYELRRPLPFGGARSGSRRRAWAVGIGGLAVTAVVAGAITAASLARGGLERSSPPAPRQAAASAPKPQAAQPAAASAAPAPAPQPLAASAATPVEPALTPAPAAPPPPDPTTTAALGPTSATPSPLKTGLASPSPATAEPPQAVAALPSPDAPPQPSGLAAALAGGTVALGRNVDANCLAAPLQAVLSDVAAKFGRVTVVSTHQLNTENHSRGSVRHKLHTACKAVDFTTARDPSEVMAYLRGRREVAGINSYRPNGLIHIDLNEGARVARAKPR